MFTKILAINREIVKTFIHLLRHFCLFLAWNTLLHNIFLVIIETDYMAQVFIKRAGKIKGIDSNN